MRRSLTTALVEVLNYRELIPMLVPAALYLLADRLHHVSTRRSDVAAFQVLSQSKVLTAALFGKVFGDGTIQARGAEQPLRDRFGSPSASSRTLGWTLYQCPGIIRSCYGDDDVVIGCCGRYLYRGDPTRGREMVYCGSAAVMVMNGCLIAAAPRLVELDGFVFSAWLVALERRGRLVGGGGDALR